MKIQIKLVEDKNFPGADKFSSKDEIKKYINNDEVDVIEIIDANENYISSFQKDIFKEFWEYAKNDEIINEISIMDFYHKKANPDLV